MQKLYPLTGRIQYYPWGSLDGIPKILNIENIDQSPMAEIWYGTHPKAPSEVITGKGKVSLQEVINRSPEKLLGEANATRFNNRLPFLLKILSAASPLSIQVHPDREHARQGYEKEEREKIPIDSPERNYRDASHKPEYIYALTPFHALKGFRQYDEIIENLKKFAPETMDTAAEQLACNPDDKRLQEFLRQLLTADSQQRQKIHAEVTGISNTLKEKDPTAAWIQRLCLIYRDDPAVLAPAFLNLLELRPGDALYLEPGEIHAYLEGTGLELMAASDNVLRGGLTSKHMDIEELEKNTRFTPSENKIYSTIPEGHLSSLPCFTEEFLLSFFTGEKDGKEVKVRELAGPAILLCLEGENRISIDGEEEVLISRGASFFISGESGDIALKGKGTLAIASIPPIGKINS